MWRLSVFEKLHAVSKAHDDAIKSLAFHVPSGSVISAGLDKTVQFWSLEEQPRGAIFSGVLPIEENEEHFANQPEQQEENISSLLELQGVHQSQGHQRRQLSFFLKKTDSLLTERIIEMQLPKAKPDEIFLLVANNKCIDRLNLEEKSLVPGYIRENEDIMTFCVSPSGALLVTSLVGVFPCFHLWMVDHRSHVGENPFKMFSNRKFYWRTSEPDQNLTNPFRRQRLSVINSLFQSCIIKFCRRIMVTLTNLSKLREQKLPKKLILLQTSIGFGSLERKKTSRPKFPLQKKTQAQAEIGSSLLRKKHFF